MPGRVSSRVRRLAASANSLCRLGQLQHGDRRLGSTMSLLAILAWSAEPRNLYKPLRCLPAEQLLVDIDGGNAHGQPGIDIGGVGDGAEGSRERLHSFVSTAENHRRRSAHPSCVLVMYLGGGSKALLVREQRELACTLTRRVQRKGQLQKREILTTVLYVPVLRVLWHNNAVVLVLIVRFSLSSQSLLCPGCALLAHKTVVFKI